MSHADTLGGYGTTVTSGTGVGGNDANGRDVVDKNYTLVAGSVTGFSVNISAIGTGTHVIRLKVWRQNGTNLVLVEQSEEFTVTGAGVSSFSLGTPFDCQTGDYPAVWIADAAHRVYADAAAGKNLIYKNGNNTGTQAESGFTTLSNYVLAVAVTGTAGALVTLTEPADGTIIQRVGTAGSLTISGTYSGTPTAIQARVVEDGTSTEVVGWTTIDDSLSGGTFSGTLSSIPQGGWYNVQARHSSDTAIVDNGSNKFGVGMLIPVLGQSNAEKWFSAGSGTPNTTTRKYTESGWATNSGAGAIAFANAVQDGMATSIPIGLLDYGVGSTSIADWISTDAGKPYPFFQTGLTAVGGTCEMVVWIQGEQDGYNGTNATTYKTDLGTFVSNIRSDTSKASLPIMIGIIGRHTACEECDVTWQAIKDAQMSFIKATANTYVAATYNDLALANNVHLQDAAYATLGGRFAQTALYILGETTTPYRGPAISKAILADASTVDVKIAHSGGTDFTPTEDITGFEVFDGGSAATISSAVRRTANTIRLTLSAPTTGTVTVRYQYGAAPTITGAILDNATLTLPLEGITDSGNHTFTAGKANAAKTLMMHSW
jgi:hypothetical protein